jgi:hypothetical protein
VGKEVEEGVETGGPAAGRTGEEVVADTGPSLDSETDGPTPQQLQGQYRVMLEREGALHMAFAQAQQWLSAW